MIINYHHFTVCILFPEVSYCCSTYNVPPTTCSYLLSRTLWVLDRLEPTLRGLVASAVPSEALDDGGAWCTVTSAACAVLQSRKAQSKQNTTTACFIAETDWTVFLQC